MEDFGNFDVPLGYLVDCLVLGDPGSPAWSRSPASRDLTSPTVPLPARTEDVNHAAYAVINMHGREEVKTFSQLAGTHYHHHPPWETLN